VRAGAIEYGQSLLDASDEMDLDADWREPRLIEIGYAFEPATNERIPLSAAP
jgi:hypothetical protein